MVISDCLGCGGRSKRPQDQASESPVSFVKPGRTSSTPDPTKESKELFHTGEDCV
jgi:hypothetical protein